VKLLHVLPSLDPAGGGPMESVLQGSLACQRMGHAVEVLTLDDPQAAYLAGYPLAVHALGPARSGYGYTARYVPWLREHAGGYDAVVVNGLWQYHALGAWQALHGGAVPYYVYTHGMLDPWFKKTYPLKHAKKWLYWPWADYRLLRDARAVLFTCEEERLLARQSFWLYRAREIVVSFGTSPPPADAERMREVFLEHHPHLRGRRILLFLSRIHEKKGCDLLIEAYARVAAQAPDLHLVIAGPDQTGLQASLQARAAELGLADRISWPGMLRGDLKWGAFHASAAYVLPSHQENFGIAVAEALACGLPVLISDKVNIWREIDAAGAGFVETDSVAGTERALRRWLATPADEQARMKERAAALFSQRFSADAMATSLLDVVRRRGAGDATTPAGHDAGAHAAPGGNNA
jgi:glycosyltransferase involved in cell wall biosynthesis